MPIDMPPVFQSVETVHGTPYEKNENVYSFSQRKNKIATDNLGLKIYDEGNFESSSNSMVSYEVEFDEFSKQMKMAKEIMRKNQAVLKRLAE